MHETAFLSSLPLQLKPTAGQSLQVTRDLAMLAQRYQVVYAANCRLGLRGHGSGPALVQPGRATEERAFRHDRAASVAPGGGAGRCRLRDRKSVV